LPELRWSRNALGYALELSAKNRQRIAAAVSQLQRFPRLGTALLGPYEGKRRLVVGPFSVVYEYREQQDEVLVLFIVYGGLGT
jgi:mRNA-degrading endonuclease RelE of RelBE toxin-antitoxin system